MSNCKQSPLLFQYCVGLYESDQLDEVEKGRLEVTLRKISENKPNTTQQVSGEGREKTPRLNG